MKNYNINMPWDGIVINKNLFCMFLYIPIGCFNCFYPFWCLNYRYWSIMDLPRTFNVHCLIINRFGNAQPYA